MKIYRILRYFEILFLLVIILTPVVIVSTPLRIHFGPTQIGFREGDIIQLTINDYSFDYNLSYLNDYNVTAGLYLGPFFNFDELEKKDTYTIEELMSVSYNINLFQGNTSSHLQYDFQIDSIGKKKRYANVSIVNSTKSFIVSRLYNLEPAPFFDTSLAYGLTFSTEVDNSTISYIHLRRIFLFSTSETRDALNWYSRHGMFYPFYDFSRYDKDTFRTVHFYENYFTSTTYILQEGSNNLKEVSSHFAGLEYLLNTGDNFQSNITTYLGLPTQSYWNFDVNFDLRYFRGGEEI